MGAEQTSTAPAKPGDLLAAKYRVERVLDDGGLYAVYVARHESTGSRVALHVLHPVIAASREATTRFLAEARNVTSILSDSVVQVLDVGMLRSGLPYVAVEFLEGTDLAVHLAQSGSPAPVPQAVDWLMGAIDGIAHAHAAGLVHGGLKPSSLFLLHRGDGSAGVQVRDFGLNKVIAATGVSANVVFGSSAYRSPEQLLDASRADEAGDLWALGVIAYELLTGKLPFRAPNSLELFDAIHRTKPATPRYLRPEIAPDLEAIVLRCLRPNPDERFVTAAELGLALAPFGTVAAKQALERVIHASWASAGAFGGGSVAPVTSSPPAGGPSTPPWSSASGWPPARPLPASSAPASFGPRTAAVTPVALLLLAALCVGGYWLARLRAPTGAAPAAQGAPPAPAASETVPASDAASESGWLE